MKKKVTPLCLATKSNCVEVCHEYDWQKQSVKYDTCKAGSMYQTGTTSMGNQAIEDWQQD